MKENHPQIGLYYWIKPHEHSQARPMECAMWKGTLLFRSYKYQIKFDDVYYFHEKPLRFCEVISCNSSAEDCVNHNENLNPKLRNSRKYLRLTELM